VLLANVAYLAVLTPTEMLSSDAITVVISDLDIPIVKKFLNLFF